MSEHKIFRKLFLGFISIHILHHAAKEPFYGAWMMEELKRHGYSMSPGTLYPLLHGLEKDGLISSVEMNIEGKMRKYYSATESGKTALLATRGKVYELFREIKSEAGEES